MQYIPYQLIILLSNNLIIKITRNIKILLVFYIYEYDQTVANYIHNVHARTKIVQKYCICIYFACILFIID